MPATAIAVKQNHWIAYDRCGPSPNSGVTIGNNSADWPLTSVAPR